MKCLNFWDILSGIKNLYVHIQKDDLLKTPVDEVHLYLNHICCASSHIILTYNYSDVYLLGNSDVFVSLSTYANCFLLLCILQGRAEK